MTVDYFGLITALIYKGDQHFMISCKQGLGAQCWPLVLPGQRNDKPSLVINVVLMKCWFIQLRTAGTESSPKSKKLCLVLSWEWLAETKLSHVVRGVQPRA